MAGNCINKLCSDANPVAALPDTAFEHVSHALFAADLLNVDCLVFVNHGRIPGDDE